MSHSLREMPAFDPAGNPPSAELLSIWQAEGRHYSEAESSVKNKWIGARGRPVRMKNFGKLGNCHAYFVGGSKASRSRRATN